MIHVIASGDTPRFKRNRTASIAGLSGPDDHVVLVRSLERDQAIRRHEVDIVVDVVSPASPSREPGLVVGRIDDAPASAQLRLSIRIEDRRDRRHRLRELLIGRKRTRPVASNRRIASP